MVWSRPNGSVFLRAMNESTTESFGTVSGGRSARKVMMNEQQWLVASDPGPMMVLLQSRRVGTERQCRLFGCACLRQIWSLLPNEDYRNAIELGEQFADGVVNGERLFM